MSRFLNLSSSYIKDAATSLREGNLVAFPTETVYGLGADASNKSAVKKIYEAKGRPKDHPVIVHISSIYHLNKWARDIPDYAMKLADVFWPGPMTLILPRTELAKDFITGSQNNVGIRVPSHAMALELLEEFESQGGLGVAAPSANRFGAVSPTSAADVHAELSNYLGPTDLVLDGGSSLHGLESTIINCTQISPNILRPGAITSSMINELIGITIKSSSETNGIQINTPGLLDSHYSPRAEVYLNSLAGAGDGFIALACFPTPSGAIRLASPLNNLEFAQMLYKALRLTDTMKLKKVFVIPPQGEDIAVAIYDRLKRCAFKG
jgi:L-threonylcarbamoyladenylate synthase